MPNGHQHTRAVYIVSHICGASCLQSVTNTLVSFISVLIYALPRDHGVSPTLWYLDLTVRGVSDGQRDCNHTPVLALLASEVEGCGRVWGG
jgi:hypothetical protein